MVGTSEQGAVDGMDGMDGMDGVDGVDGGAHFFKQLLAMTTRWISLVPS
jgi:hypothetical protein